MLAPSNGISYVRHDLDDRHFSPFSATTSLTPLFKSLLEMFKPIPDAQPVTMATFPSKPRIIHWIFLLLLYTLKTLSISN
jgi:hypothetical protein